VVDTTAVAQNLKPDPKPVATPDLLPFAAAPRVNSASTAPAVARDADTSHRDLVTWLCRLRC
jgi:hypothetical protein